MSNRILRHITATALVFFCLFLTTCAAKKAVKSPTIEGEYVLTDKIFKGSASWYGPRFHGRRTASGERYNMYQLTAAHKTLPFGTLLKITNLQNKKSIVVKVNDRGPFIGRRVLDLSYGAAKKLDFIGHGIISVQAQIVLKKPESKGLSPQSKLTMIAAP